MRATLLCVALATAVLAQPGCRIVPGRDVRFEPTPLPVVRAMLDLSALAFQCDQTRVITFMLGNAGSGRAHPHLGITESHHELSHHGRNPEKQNKIREINRFHITQLAYILEKMKSSKNNHDFFDMMRRGG